MSKMLDRINKFKDRNKSNSNGNSFNDDENIFFDFTEGTHRIRLVREWVCVHSHWIAPSKFSKVKIYDESAFDGEDRLKKSVNCPDFDVNTETSASEKTCVICKVRAAVNDILYNNKDLADEHKKQLEDVAYFCSPNERVFFLCIDRDNPEIAPGKKGFKIIEFPKSLMEKLCNLIENNTECNPLSDEDGVDFIITKARDGKRIKYDIQYDIKGTSVRQTPLTEEELSYTFHDIKKIMCKMPDQENLYDRLKPDYRDLIKGEMGTIGSMKDVGSPDTEDDGDESVPF